MKKIATLTKSTVSFKVDKDKVEFTVIHNLYNTFGLSLNDAVNSWLARTKGYTSKSLCKYIMSKSEDFVAMTEGQYNKLIQIGSSNKK